MAETNLQLFLLGAERLLRCRWDGRSEDIEILNSAMDWRRPCARWRGIPLIRKNFMPRR